MNQQKTYQQQSDDYNEYIKKLVNHIMGVHLESNIGTNYSVNNDNETIDIDYEEVRDDQPKQLPSPNEI